MKASQFELHKSLSDDHWWVVARCDLIKRFMTGMKCLDVGCGVGRFFDSFSDIYGIDISDDALRHAKEKECSGLVKADAQVLPFKSDTFDVVLCLDVVEHVDDDQALIQEIKRVLTSHGAIILTAPAFDFLWSDDDDLVGHKRRYSWEQFNALFTGQFQFIRVNYRYCLFFLPFLFFRRLIHGNTLAVNPGKFNKIIAGMMKFETWLLYKRFRFPFGIGFFALLKDKL